MKLPTRSPWCKRALHTRGRLNMGFGSGIDGVSKIGCRSGIGSSGRGNIGPNSESRKSKPKRSRTPSSMFDINDE
jgi:hypothetical protein